MPPEAHAKYSASGAHIWLNCTAQPDYAAQFPESTSEYAEEGRLAHEFCELKATKKFTLALSPKTVSAKLTRLRKDARFDPEMDKTSDLYVEHLTEQAMSFPEMPYVALEVRVDYSHIAPGGFGTCDCVMIGKDTLVITDYKHGKGVPVSAENNPQMRLYALGALHQYEPLFGDTIERVRMNIDQPRLNSYDTEEISVTELREWGEWAKTIAEKSARGEGEFVPGEHCRFCRGKAQCRARAIANSAAADFHAIATETLTNTEVGNLLIEFAGVVAWYKDLEAYALAICLEGGEIPGWKAVAGRAIRKWTDADAAFSALRAAGYEEALLYDRKPKSLAEIEKMMGKHDFTELLGQYVMTPPGTPTLATENDKREKYNSAKADFKEIVNL